MQLALEGSCLALQLLRLVILREGDVYFELVAGIMAHDLLLKAGDKLSAAQGQAVIFALAAIQEALEVDYGDIIVLSRPVLHGYHSGIAFLHLLDLGVDILVSHLGGLLYGLDALIILNGHFRLCGQSGGKGKALRPDLFHVEIDLVLNDLQPGFLDRLVQGVGIKGVDGVLIKDFLAEILFHKSAGGLALTEARNGNLLALLFKSGG